MANIWKKFSDLLPKKQLVIGTVVSIDNTNKVSVVALSDTTQVTVLGTSVIVGNKCFIEDGKITSEAPNIPIVSVEIN